MNTIATIIGATNATFQVGQELTRFPGHQRLRATQAVLIDSTS